MKNSLCSWCKKSKHDNINIMNDKTLEKLSRNPHYKMTSKQKNQLASIRPEKPVIEFGVPNYHANEPELHNTKVNKKKRYGQKQI